MTYTMIAVYILSSVCASPTPKQTLATGLTQDQCNTQAIQQSVKMNNKCELIYCIPTNVLSEYTIK